MRIVAHRGNVPGQEEHTRDAFLASLALPIHGIEFDVRLSRDLELMVHHDATALRSAPGLQMGRISALDSAELQQINIGSEDNPQYMLRLEDVLEIHQDHPDKHLYIEIKHPTRYGRITEEKVVNRLVHAGLADAPCVHVISFSHRSMHRMRALAPRLDRIYLRRVWENRVNPGDILISRPTGLGLSITTARVRPQLVGAHGLPTYMWTVNSAEDIRFAADLGVDIMATDDPELALEILSSDEHSRPG